jgi:proline iminopeptidase
VALRGDRLRRADAFIAAGDDIRPPWPLAQLAALVPRGRYSTVSGVPHTFWFTHPEVWTRTITNACTE